MPLQHPAPNAELSLATDASGTHIGGVMQQKSGDHWRPLRFFPNKLTDTEKKLRYSSFDCKLFFFLLHMFIQLFTLYLQYHHEFKRYLRYYTVTDR